MTSKVCSGCGREKTLEDFPKHRRGRLGRSEKCRECKRAQDKAYYEKNSEKVKARVNKKRCEDPEKEKERQRQKYLKKREHYIAKAKEWVQNNPERRREISRKYATMYENLKKERDLDPDYKVILERDGLFCYLCQREITDDEKYHIDHIIPITKGGWHAEFNLAIAHDSCNISKQNKLPDELEEAQKTQVLQKLDALKPPSYPEGFKQSF